MKHTTTYRQKDSGWQIIISYKDTDGKWHQKSRQGFQRKSDAKEAEAELLAQIKKAPRPVDRSISDITLVEFCKEYLKLRKSITQGTKHNYINAVDALRDVAKKPMRMITYLDVQTAVSGWNIAPVTQKQYLSKLAILFRAAVKPYGIIFTNFIPNIEIPKAKGTTERLTVSEEQFRKLMANTKDDIKLALAICYYTGLRRGELLGLTWPDISKQSITINKQLDTKHFGYMDPKTKNGFRTIPIPGVLAKMLTQYKNSHPLDIHRRLFSRPYGTYYGMKQAIKKIDRRLSPHCLRHTYATTLLAKGVDIRTVAALMGDNAQTVIKTYIHYSDDMRRAAADDIEKIFAENF